MQTLYSLAFHFAKLSRKLLERWQLWLLVFCNWFQICKWQTAGAAPGLPGFSESRVSDEDKNKAFAPSPHKQEEKPEKEEHWFSDREHGVGWTMTLQKCLPETSEGNFAWNEGFCRCHCIKDLEMMVLLDFDSKRRGNRLRDAERKAKDWNDTSTSQGMPRIACGHQATSHQRARDEFSISNSRRHQHLPSPWFQLSGPPELWENKFLLF